MQQIGQIKQLIIGKHIEFNNSIIKRLSQKKSLLNNDRQMMLYWIGDSSQYICAQYAKSGRSVCRKCKQKIPNNQIRIGLLCDQSDYPSSNWYHKNCFHLKPKHNVLELETLHQKIWGIDQLEPEDYDSVLDYLKQQLKKLLKKLPIKENKNKSLKDKQNPMKQSKKSHKQDNSDKSQQLQKSVKRTRSKSNLNQKLQQEVKHSNATKKVKTSVRRQSPSSSSSSSQQSSPHSTISQFQQIKKACKQAFKQQLNQFFQQFCKKSLDPVIKNSFQQQYCMYSFKQMIKQTVKQSLKQYFKEQQKQKQQQNKLTSTNLFTPSLFSDSLFNNSTSLQQRNSLPYNSFSNQPLFSPSNIHSNLLYSNIASSNNSNNTNSLFGSKMPNIPFPAPYKSINSGPALNPPSLSILFPNNSLLTKYITPQQHSKYKNQLLPFYMKKSANDLKQILAKNNQAKTGSKSQLAHKCADGKQYGQIPTCSKCGGGKLRFDRQKETYKCPGYMEDTDFVHCDGQFNFTDIKRNPWTD